ncbi:MAG: PIG-L family deacetylase [Alkalispirochaeta sp.]
MNSSDRTRTIVRRRRQQGQIVTGSLRDTLPGAEERERWLFISPHDDDPAISAGMFLATAAAEGVQIRMRIATDGSMGYTSVVAADEVVERRRRETRDSCRQLGIDDVEWYNYPDARLHRWQGRFPVGDVSVTAGATSNVLTSNSAGTAGAAAEHPAGIHTVAGYTGLQNSITAEIRSYRPTRILVMSAEDYHPDHKIVHQEVMISIFHAQGDVWPELGSPIEALPWVHECAAYAPFAGDPDLELTGTAELFERKLQAIATFVSQTQIARLVAGLKASGPYEYLRSFPFETYSPQRYAGLFHSPAAETTGGGEGGAQGATHGGAHKATHGGAQGATHGGAHGDTR